MEFSTLGKASLFFVFLMALRNYNFFFAIVLWSNTINPPTDKRLAKAGYFLYDKNRDCGMPRH